ncbi:alanyl-tRNA editing protein [Lacrimispora sp.]|uniref:alanyl-tRNA editing protein n=1 Tax=Lacrimispora sp. TaxID=2719234 RepID=UPI0028A5CAA9|nr:alanyl-tRNA editing protein [Lacrimispora sp.]
MEKLYYDRPYVKTFEAVVIDCRPGKDCLFEVLLDRTAFYPEGGGQPADMGSLGEAAVLDVRERPEGIVHITDKPLKAGSRVNGIIDWERRFCHMQNHSGEHLLSGIVHKHYGFDNVGFHMGKDELTVDFNGILTMEQIEAVETEVNELIWQDILVLESYPSKEELSRIDYRSKKELTGQVRLIEFPGGDVCACCGTHVITAGEIGILKVTGMIHYKGGVRVTMLCGRMALKDYRKKQKTVSGISVLLSAKPDHLLEAVDRLKEEGQKKDGRIGQLSKELLERKAGDYPELDAPLLVFERDLSPVQLRQFCTMLYEGKKGSVVLACSGDEGVFQYALGSGREDMRTLSKALNGRLNGRGGGSSLMAQGTFQALQEDIRKAFEEES